MNPFHQQIAFTHFVARYDTIDARLAVVVAYATSYEEANALLHSFIAFAPLFAPTALYAVRAIEEIESYLKRFEEVL